jgi:hypothetical protein
MKTLKNYFREMLLREGKRPVQLVATWKDAEVSAIRNRFKYACRSSRLGQKSLVVEPNLASQALGNRLARFLTDQITGHLEDFTIRPYAGQG